MNERHLTSAGLHLIDLPGGGSRRGTVVFLHGLGSCGEDWALQLEALRGRARLVAPDLPGHGGSAGFDGWPRIEDFSRRLHAALDGLEIDSAHLVGLSIGGAVALQAALDRPDRVRSLTLVNSFARLRPSGRGLARGLVRLALVLAGRLDLAGGWVAAELFPAQAQAPLRRLAADRIRANRRRDYLRAIQAALRLDLRSRLSELNVPTVVIRGEGDRSLSLRTQLDLAQGIRGARLAIVPGSRHATPVDRPEVFNRLLTEFLAQVEVGGGGPASGRPRGSFEGVSRAGD